MSRRCPPELREKRDWEALPRELRDLTLKVRTMLERSPGIPVGITVRAEDRGHLWVMTFSNGRRREAMDLTHVRLGGDLPEFVANALRRLAR